MKAAVMLVLLALLAACGETPRARYDRVAGSPFAELRGEFPLGNSVGEVRTFTVDGTKCIVLGHDRAMALSCDWGR